MGWLVWVLGGLALVALEIFAGGELWLLLTGIAAILVGLLAAFGLPGPELQLVVFALLLVSVFFLRRRLAPSARSAVPQGSEALVGEIGTVTRWSAQAGMGQVEVRGSSWRAISEADLAEDASVRVTAVEGIRLQVEPTGHRDGGASGSPGREQEDRP